MSTTVDHFHCSGQMPVMEETPALFVDPDLLIPPSPTKLAVPLTKSPDITLAPGASELDGEKKKKKPRKKVCVI